ncbi:MAG: LytTR family DNA-binding domain-containing protein [Saprospiraceae bacterium]|nr:LytTR family transcriptional regulator [Saprospiraceae bacterium]MDW8228675.1 LytTR family DNA-binding domain-containing protein [Saprospiraceae bacterium]
MFKPVITTVAKDTPEPYNGAVLHPRLPRRRRIPRISKCKKLALPTLEGFVFEKMSRILYLEAQGNYTALHLSDGRQILLSRTLGDMDRLLPEDRFVRIHRSFIVHLKHVVRYIRNKHGSVVLSNGTTLNVSPNYRETFVVVMSRYFYGFQP